MSVTVSPEGFLGKKLNNKKKKIHIFVLLMISQLFSSSVSREAYVLPVSVGNNRSGEKTENKDLF